jgi:hypothetical protein
MEETMDNDNKVGAAPGTMGAEVVRGPFDDEPDDDDPHDEYMDEEYCCDCGTPSHAIDNGLCPMCFECTGGMGHGRR